MSELLVVVLLIALLGTTTGGVFYGSYKRMLVEKGAKGLYLAAKYARLLAVEEQTQCRLVINKEEGNFCLVLGEAAEFEEESSQIIIQDNYSKPTQLEGNVRFADEIQIAHIRQAEFQGSEMENTITFYPDGTAETAVVPITDGKSYFTMYVSAATGKAKVEFGEPKEAAVDVIDLDMDEL